MTSGVLLIDKPQGPTSHHVVRKVKKIFGGLKTGHTGTLDPMATGLLVVLLGHATKLSNILQSDEKEYEGACLWGAFTDTGDKTGKVIGKTEKELPSKESIIESMGKFIGRQEQIPPMYSAKKVDGRPLYMEARKGNDVPRKASTVTIFSFEYFGAREDGFDFKVKCGKGVYIRTLIEDLCKDLKGAGHLGALRRTVIGEYNINKAYTIDKLEMLATQGQLENSIVSLDKVCERFPRVIIDDLAVKRLRDGRPPNPEEIELFDPFERGDVLRIVDPKDTLLALVNSLIASRDIRKETIEGKAFKFTTNLSVKRP